MHADNEATLWKKRLTATMSSPPTEKIETKAGHLPAVKAGGMRIVQKHQSANDAPDKNDKDSKEYETEMGIKTSLLLLPRWPIRNLCPQYRSCLPPTTSTSTSTSPGSEPSHNSRPPRPPHAGPRPHHP
uniref:Death-associated protein 1-like n=1 Tax=Sinocyclocheilus rhinocerous TaxID=307959 RepID=A0A673GHW3_9TELE